LGPGLDVMLTLTGIEEMEDYEPYTPDIDIESRISRMEEYNSNDDGAEIDEQELFNVEYIANKQFNVKIGQYEFLINALLSKLNYETLEITQEMI